MPLVKQSPAMDERATENARTHLGVSLFIFSFGGVTASIGMNVSPLLETHPLWCASATLLYVLCGLFYVTTRLERYSRLLHKTETAKYRRIKAMSRMYRDD